MTDILNSFWGRKKPKPVTPERPVTEPALDEYVIVNNPASRPQTSMYPTAQSNSDYESLFSYLRVTEMQPSSDGGSQPIRPAPPAPTAGTLPYPLRRATIGQGHEMSSSSYTSVTTTTTTSASIATESSSATHYLSGIPFQLSKELGGEAMLNQLNKDMHIKSPNLSEYEYSFSVEMQVIQESSPSNTSPTMWFAITSILRNSEIGTCGLRTFCFYLCAS